MRIALRQAQRDRLMFLAWMFDLKFKFEFNFKLTFDFKFTFEFRLQFPRIVYFC